MSLTRHRQPALVACPSLQPRTAASPWPSSLQSTGRQEHANLAADRSMSASKTLWTPGPGARPCACFLLLSKWPHPASPLESQSWKGVVSAAGGLLCSTPADFPASGLTRCVGALHRGSRMLQLHFTSLSACWLKCLTFLCSLRPHVSCPCRVQGDPCLVSGEGQ